MLATDNARFALFPIQHTKAYEMYKQQIASFWTTEEVDLAGDMKDYQTLTQDERHFILRVLAFFASADGIVNENLAGRFLKDVQAPELRQFYGFQIGMETIHSEMYALLIDTYERDKAAKEKLFRAIDTVPSIQMKAEWALKWLSSKTTFSERLIAFACVEGIFFSASFCAIFYLKKRGIMPGLCFSNELISRDEGLHRDFACLVYNTMVEEKLGDERVQEIVREAVEAEEAFVKDALKVNIIGMNAEQMMEYVRFVADHLLASLRHKKLYNAKNPFDWMEMISLQGKTNFFEKRVGDYQKAGVMSDAPKVFNLDEDF